MRPVRSAIVVAFACAVTAGLGAQAPGTSASSGSARLVRIGGCLESVPEDDIAAAGTKYVLTYARRATVRDGPTYTKYRVIVDDAKIQSEVGTRVQITGYVEEASEAGPMSTAGGPTAIGAASDAAEQARRASAANLPKLRVETIQSIAVTDGTGQTHSAEHCP